MKCDAWCFPWIIPSCTAPFDAAYSLLQSVDPLVLHVKAAKWLTDESKSE
jgi:hypothetical protein